MKDLGGEVINMADGSSSPHEKWSPPILLGTAGHISSQILT